MPYCEASSSADISITSPVSSMRMRTVCLSVPSEITRARPAGVVTRLPTFGRVPRSSRYSSTSNERQQRRRPQTPEIFVGLGGRSCSRASRIETLGKLVCQLLQHSASPHTPTSPRARARSRSPTCSTVTSASSTSSHSPRSAPRSTRSDAEKVT